MRFRTALAASLLALGSAGVPATTTDWGVHPDFKAVLGTVVGSFTDYFDFEITQAPAWLLSSTVVANNLHIDGSHAFNIDFGNYEVYSVGGDLLPRTLDDTMLTGASYHFDGSTGNVTHSLQLVPGEYYYKVSGDANGSQGGLYLLTSAVNPIPEPETLAMYLAGLGVVGYLARRRQRSG